MANEIYNFLKQNNLTQKSEQDFIKEYSNPDKAKELHGFLQQNNLTKKDSAQFYDEYFKPQTLQQPKQTTTNGIGVLKKQLPFKAVTDFQQSIVDKVVPQKNTENNPIVGIDIPMEVVKPKTQTVYRSNTFKEEVPIKTSAYDVANAMSTEQLLTANNDVFKTVVNQANGDTGLDEFNKQSDKNNNIQAFNRESELYNVRLKTLKDRAGQLERVLASKYQTPDFMEQVKSQMATVKQKSEQYNAYVQSRSKEVIVLQTELEAIVEQGKTGAQPIEVLKPAYDAKKAQLDAIQRDDEQKRGEIEQLQNDFNGKLDDPDFALYSQIYDKINELSGEQQGLISKPEFAEYRKLLDEGDKAQAKKDAMKKAYQSKGILGKAVDIYAGIGMATNPAAYFLDDGEQVDKTFTGAKIADEGDKLLGRTLKALASVPKMLDISNPIGDENKYDVFDKMFDQAIYASKKRDILNPTATDVQRDIIQKYADVGGYRVMLDENGKPTNDVRDASFYKVNDKTQKEITDKYNENPKAYKTESDFSFSTLTTKATPTILDMGTMMATAMLSGGTTGLVAGAGTAGTVSTATTVGVSAAQMYGDMYESGLNAGLTPQEANDFATLTSIMTGMVTLVNPMEANIVKGTASKSIGKFISNSISKADVQLIRSGKMSIGQYAKRMAKEGVKNTFGENLEELVLEPAVQRAIETYYNTKAQKNGQQGFEDLNKPFFDAKQTIETAMITTMASLLMTPIEVSHSIPEQRKIALQNALDNPQAFIDLRNSMLNDGDVSQEKFDYEVKAFEEISKQYNTIKPEIREDLHDDLAELLLKKYTLKNTMSQVNDEVLNRKNQVVLDDINKRLEEVASGTYDKVKEQAIDNIKNPATLIDNDKVATYNGNEVEIVDDLADGMVLINTNNPEIGNDGYIEVPKGELLDIRDKPQVEQATPVNIQVQEFGEENIVNNNEQEIPITPIKPIDTGQEVDNGTGVQQNKQNGGTIQQGDGQNMSDKKEVQAEEQQQELADEVAPQEQPVQEISKEEKLLNDKHDRLVGLMREYNSTPKNKKTHKSDLRQKMLKLSSDLGYSMKSDTGDKIVITNQKGKKIQKKAIKQNDKRVTEEQLTKFDGIKQWLNWNGNMLDWHIDAQALGLTWQELRSAKKSLDEGKITPTVRRVVNAIDEYSQMDALPRTRGTSANTEKGEWTQEDFAIQKEMADEMVNEDNKLAVIDEIDMLDLSEKEIEQVLKYFDNFTNENGQVDLEKAKADLDNIFSGIWEESPTELPIDKLKNIIDNEYNRNKANEQGGKGKDVPENVGNENDVEQKQAEQPKQADRTTAEIESELKVKNAELKKLEEKQSKLNAQLEENLKENQLDLLQGAKPQAMFDDKIEQQKIAESLKEEISNKRKELSALQEELDNINQIELPFQKTDKAFTPISVQVFTKLIDTLKKAFPNVKVELFGTNDFENARKELEKWGVNVDLLSVNDLIKSSIIASSIIPSTNSEVNSQVKNIEVTSNNVNSNVIDINDDRKIDKATNLPITDKNKRATSVMENDIKTIALYSNKHGVDPYTVISLAMQETNFDGFDDNPFHYDEQTAREYSQYENPIERAVVIFKDKLKYAEKLGKKSEEDKIQAYNGYGKIGGGGKSIKSWYGINTSVNPIDMSKNPLYGKRIIDIRENIIKKNPNIVKLVESQNKNVAFLKTKDGTIYGFKTPDGKVFINTDRLNSNTPIHEFGHIWQAVFPQEFARGIELLKLSPQGQALIREIQKNPAYKGKTISEIQAEALVTAIGNKGEAIFNSNPTLFNKFKEWLSDFFKKLGDKLGIKDLSADDKLNMFTKKVTGELLGGKALSKNVGENSDIDLQMEKAIKQSKDIKLVKDKAGNLLAPNGKKSNLNETQWRIVRTDAFKNWFGDWENDPENASKVVDENGEPLVVYHGTNKFGFTEFDKVLNFFSSNKSVAKTYEDKWGGAEKGIYEVFLNIKNIEEVNANGSYFNRVIVVENTMLSKESKLSVQGVVESILGYRFPKIITDKNGNGKTEGVKIINVKDDLLGNGKVGVSDVYVAINPNQIKLADGTNTTFNPESNDIRFQIVNNPSKEEIGKAYDKAQQYLETTDFNFDTDQRDAFIEEIKNNPALKAMFTTSQLEKVYEALPLSVADKVKIKYKLLVYNLKADNSANKAGLKQQQKQMVADITALIKDNLKGITGRQAERLINLATNAVEKNSTVRLGKIINQIANLADQRAYQKAKTLYEIIKARSKRKGGVQSGKLTGVLQDFATINPLDVSDIAKYVELAEKVKQASNVVKQPTDADSDLVYDEVQAYVKAQQDEINSNAINDTLEDDAMTFFTVLDNKTKAKFGDDKTFDDLNEPQQREVFASITKDDIKKYGLTDEERDMVEAFKEIKTEQKRQDFITATYNKIGELKDLLANSVGVITQSPAEKEITDALLDVKLDDMTATEMARVLKLINGITQNNDYSGGSAFVAQQKANKINSKIGTLKSEIGEFRELTKTGSKFRNFQQVAVAMAKGKKLGAKLMEALGVNELMRGIAKTKTYSHNLQKAFKAEKFKSSVFEPISQMRQSIYAAVIQTKIGDDIKEAEHIARWKNIIEKNIENLRTINNDGYKEQADLLQKALDEVIGDRQQLKDIADNMANIDSEGKRVVQFFIDKHVEQKPRFRDNSLLFHNKEIEEYNSYTKLSITSLTGDSVQDTGEKLMDDARKAGITKKKSKSMIDRANYESLGDNTGLDFNFINKQLKALGDNEYDINTSAEITTLATIFKSDNQKLRELLGAENFNLLKKRLQTIVGTSKYDETTVLDDILNEATKVSRTIALGSLTQVLKQSTVLMSTYLNSVSKDNLGGLDFTILFGNKQQKENVHKLFAQSEIGARRAEGAGGYYDNTTIKKNISDSNAKKILKVIGKGKDFFSDLSMYPLRAFDILAADISWVTFYKKYLRDKGLQFDEINEYKNPNKDAMAYAETMVQTAQGANTEAGQAEVWKSAKGFTQLALPFMSFAVQAKARLVDNIMNVYNGDDRAEAGRDIGAYLTEQIAFNGVKFGIGTVVVTQLIPALLKELGLDDDDENKKGLTIKEKEKIELEKLRKLEQRKSAFVNNIVQDLTYGTVPMVDNVATKPAINFLYNHIFKTNTGIIPEYNRSTDFNILSGGTVGVGYNQFLNLKDDYNIITDNNAFGDYKSESQASVFTYKGKDYNIVHNGRYTRRDMFFNNVKGREDWSNSNIPAEVLKAFIENPSDFTLKEEVRKTGGSQDSDLKLELTEEQKTYAKIMLVADLLTFYGINETVFNQINNKVRGEMKKQTIKK